MTGRISPQEKRAPADRFLPGPTDQILEDTKHDAFYQKTSVQGSGMTRLYLKWLTALQHYLKLKNSLRHLSFPAWKFFLAFHIFFLIQRIYILCPKDKSHYLKIISSIVAVGWSKIFLKSGIAINRETRNDQGKMIQSGRFKSWIKFTH